MRAVALRKDGTVSLYVDGKKVGEGKVGATEPMIFSSDDGCDVASGHGSACIAGSMAHVETSVRVASRASDIAIAEDAESIDHLISPEDGIRIAMARQ